MTPSDSRRADATPPLTDPDIAKCVKQVSGWCQSEGECVDSNELLEVAVAKHFCSICVNCRESWEIKNRDATGWIDVTAEQMCRRIVDKNRACNDCLETWWGGAG